MSREQNAGEKFARGWVPFFEFPFDAERMDSAVVDPNFRAQATAALNALPGLIATIDEMEREAEEHDHSFELRWKADQRAIKRWHAAGGDELTWPDHADLVIWLLERLDKIEEIAVREMAQPWSDTAALVEIASIAEGRPMEPETETQRLICRPCKRGQHEHGEANCQNQCWSPWTDQNERCLCMVGVRDEHGIIWTANLAVAFDMPQQPFRIYEKRKVVIANPDAKVRLAEGEKW